MTTFLTFTTFGKYFHNENKFLKMLVTFKGLRIGDMSIYNIPMQFIFVSAVVWSYPKFHLITLIISVINVRLKF